MRDLATLLASPNPEATLAEWLDEANAHGYQECLEKWEMSEQQEKE